MTVPTLTLNNQTEIPQLGFGVFQVPPAQTAEVVNQALQVGYRHIDTAQMYQNEQEVGEALKASPDVPREELWITSKLNNGFHRPDDARRAFDETLAKLGLEQIDLFLIHWPLPTLYDGDYVSTWRTLTEFVADGRARVDRRLELPARPPRPDRGRDRRRTRGQPDRGAPLLHQRGRPRGEPPARRAGRGVVADRAGRRPRRRGDREDRRAHGRTPSQVTLRWHVERGDIVFPKTTHRERMEENFALFDFELTPDEVAAISALDRGEAGRTGPNPDTFDYVPD